MKQLSLFDQPPKRIIPPHNGTPTSQAAAERIEPNASSLRALVLDYIRTSGGATDEEIQVALGMAGNTERPRRRELEQAGLIQDSGTTRRTASGRMAVVWVAIHS